MSQPPVDLRSDTLTLPTPEMQAFMAAAPLGDDVFGEDPTINLLQEEVAERLGKEAALFVPSGSMSNQIGVRVHCKPGDELLCDVQLILKAAEVPRTRLGSYGQLGRTSWLRTRPLDQDSEDVVIHESIFEALKS